MDVKFDARAAQNLIEMMRNYCVSIQTNAKETLKLINAKGEWEDEQFKNFSEAIRLICTDLDKTLKMEAEYLTIFQNKVNELRN